MPPDIAAGVPALDELGFERTNLAALKLPAGASGAQAMFDEYLHRIDDYDKTRDFPALKGPSYLSTPLRFGTISIRQLARAAWQRTQGGSRGAEVWLSELIWRDFYHQVLHHHPQVVGHAFKREYDAIKWEHGKHADQQFAAWCEGRTGYPLVDAAMHQINQTGYMHNRLRMVTASFLTKDLGIDWRRGEALLRAAPERLRPRRQQRGLAVGGLDRLRRAAVLPHLQPGVAEREVRRPGQVHPALPAAVGQAARQADPCALAGAAGGAGGGGRRTGP